jgi:hypothetical protein
VVAPPFGYDPATNEQHPDGESVTIHATRALTRRLCALVAVIALAGVAVTGPVLAACARRATRQRLDGRVMHGRTPRDRSLTRSLGWTRITAAGY